jgi:hypothetical protein
MRSTCAGFGLGDFAGAEVYNFADDFEAEVVHASYPMW